MFLKVGQSIQPRRPKEKNQFHISPLRKSMVWSERVQSLLWIQYFPKRTSKAFRQQALTPVWADITRISLVFLNRNNMVINWTLVIRFLERWSWESPQVLVHPPWWEKPWIIRNILHMHPLVREGFQLQWKAKKRRTGSFPRQALVIPKKVPLPRSYLHHQLSLKVQIYKQGTLVECGCDEKLWTFGCCKSPWIILQSQLHLTSAPYLYLYIFLCGSQSHYFYAIEVKPNTEGWIGAILFSLQRQIFLSVGEEKKGRRVSPVLS